MRKAPNAEKAARRAGMSVEQWCHAKQQAQAAKSRGRGAQAERKLATWGDVDGQLELFEGK